MFDILSQSPLLFVIYLVALLIAIAVHEFSHALIADKLGDPTPRLQGRVTLNPRAHIDLMGILFLFMFPFPFQNTPPLINLAEKIASFVIMAAWLGLI